MSPSSAAAQEGFAPQETPEVSTKQNAEKLREEYKQRVSNSDLPPKDKEVCLKWLENDPESNKADALQMRLKHFDSAEKAAKAQEAGFKKQIKEEVQKELFSDASEKEYMKWFMEELTFGERAKYLEEKNSALHDPARKKTFQEFEALFKDFTSIPHSASSALQKRFLTADLQKRQKIVIEMKQKKTLIEESMLPSVIREALKAECINSDPKSCKERIAGAQKKHKELKSRFLKLPPLVQEEYREKFKESYFQGREDLLKEVGDKMKTLADSYRGKIRKMQQPNEKGLNLFSDTPESTKGSSAASYLDWFTNKLGIKGMEAAVANSDLDDPAREQRRVEMADVLKKLSPKDQDKAKKDFNKTDLDGREKVIQDYAAKANQPQEKRGLIRGIIQKLIRSGDSRDISSKVESFALANEIAKRKRRFRLHHNADAQETDLNEKAAEQEKSQTLEHTDKIVNSVQSDQLRNPEGHIDLKLKTLETQHADRHRLKKSLKETMHISDAQLAGDISLKTRSGDVIKDEVAYQQGELAQELGDVEAALTPKLEEQAKAAGIKVTSQQLQDELKAINWEEEGKEVIKRAV